MREWYELATNYTNAEDDDFIDMELISFSNSFFYSTQSREFEFQMCCSISDDQKETTNSPADELFYKGKLLPLHLPPRLQMVQKLLQYPAFTTATFQEDEHHYKTNNNNISAILLPCNANNSTPLALDQSFNISPSESCRISSEPNPDEYFCELSNESSRFIRDDQTKKSGSKKKLKLIKKSSLGQKLKASRAYLKSLFSRSGCSDESCAKAAGSAEEAGNLSEYNVNVAMKIPEGKIGEGTKFPAIATFMNMYSTEKEGFEDNGSSSHRKSFSGAVINRCPKMKCSSSSSSSSCDSFSSSSSFSFISNGVYELQLLKRSGSANSEIDGSIEAAIAHCKKSQELFSSRNAANEDGFWSFCVSRSGACSRDQERPGVCSI